MNTTKYLKPLFIFISLFFFIFSCGNKTLLSADELRKYVTDETNGLLKKYVTEDLTIDIFYWPKEFILYNDRNSSVSGGSNLNIDSIDYFIIKISPTRHMDRNDNLLSEIQYKTRLLVHSNTTEAEDVRYSPVQGSSKNLSYTFLFAFKSYLDKIDNEETVSIILSGNMGLESRIQFLIKDIHRVQKFIIKG